MKQTEFDFYNYNVPSNEITLEFFDNNFKKNIDDKDDFIKLCKFINDKKYILTKNSKGILWSNKNNHIKVTLKKNIMTIITDNRYHIIFTNQQYTLEKFVKIIKENI